MTRLSTTGENQALDSLGGSLPGSPVNVLAYVALATGDPSTTGANENPATGSYARQACSWNNAASGSKTNSSSLSFSTAGTTAVTFFFTASAATAGTIGIGGALTSGVTAASITVAAGAITLSAS
jgi:hypothetical protein